MNLLPEGRMRAFRHLYFLRLAVVLLLLLAAAALIHAVLLLPSYLSAREQAKERGASLALWSSLLAGSEEQEIRERVVSLAEDSAHLARLGASPKASQAVSSVISVARPGVRLTGFSFEPEADGTASMTVSGMASTREALRGFEQALGIEPYIASVELPISAYARENDIDFTILLTGTFMP